MSIASGAFEITITPCQSSPEEGGAAVARQLLDKRYQGDLAAVGRGQMLASTTATDGSAAYVAIEVVEGELGGRRGSFVLHHRGVMDRGAPTLQVEIVPDSGTGELAGITGEVTIDVDDDGAHTYALSYRLP